MNYCWHSAEGIVVGVCVCVYILKYRYLNILVSGISYIEWCVLFALIAKDNMEGSPLCFVWK